MQNAKSGSWSVLRREQAGALEKIEETMATELELQGGKYWVLSEPHGNGWKAKVVEVKGGHSEPIGIEATGETRSAADDAAERKLRRLLQAY
jgi:hypothetical protein